MASDHERIWLQHPEDADPDLGRQWCQDKVWPETHTDGEPTEYVRADLVITPADLAARVEAERVACQVVATKEEDAAADWIALADGYGGPRSPEYAVKKAEQHTARRVKLAIRALGPTPAYDAAIKAAEARGRNAERDRVALIMERFGEQASIDGDNETAGQFQSWAAAIRAAKDQPA